MARPSGGWPESQVENMEPSVLLASRYVDDLPTEGYSVVMLASCDLGKIFLKCDLSLRKRKTNRK